MLTALAGWLVDIFGDTPPLLVLASSRTNLLLVMRDCLTLFAHVGRVLFFCVCIVALCGLRLPRYPTAVGECASLITYGYVYLEFLCCLPCFVSCFSCFFFLPLLFFFFSSGVRTTTVFDFLGGMRCNWFQLRLLKRIYQY